MTIFIFLVIFFFTLLSMKNVRYGFYFFIFLIPFSPRYFAIAVGGGFALTLKRILIMLLLSFFFLLIYQNKQHVSNVLHVFKKNKEIIFVIFTLFVVKMIATLINENLNIASIAQLSNELMFSILILVIVIVFSKSIKDIKKILYIILIGVLITDFLVLIEFFKQTPLMQGLVNVEIDTHGKDLIVGRIRNELHRSMALFDNPLVLSEMLTITLPVSIYFFMFGNKKEKKLAFITLFILPFAIYTTGSRSAIMILVTLLILIFWFYLYKRVNPLARSFLKLIALLVGILTVFIIIQEAQDFYLNTSVSWRSEKGDRSTYERISQFYVVGEQIMKSPILGYGFMQNYSVELEDINNLDNYYLRLGLEAGLSGIFLFISMILIVLFYGFKEWKNSVGDEKMIFQTFLLSFIAFFMYKFFLSMPTNNIYFYILLGLFMQYRIITKEKDEKNAYIIST